MTHQQPETDQTKFLLTDFNTRLRDMEEKNRLMRERVLLLGKNLVNSRQKVDKETGEMKRTLQRIENEINEIKRISKNLTIDNEKFIKRDEIMLLERMLKDFKPLEFMRRKDVEELINQKISSRNN